MTSIKVKVNGASISATADGKITSGMVGVPVSFEYNSEWNGLTRTAVFKAGNLERSRQNIGTSDTTVPWEVLRKSGEVLFVGVEGRDADGNVVLPTVFARVKTIENGAIDSVPGAPNVENPIVGGGASIDDEIISSNFVWSSKNTVDKLCPSFIEGGNIVTCEPVEGYPLTVTASEDATKITRTGKNLFDFKGELSEIVGMVNSSGTNQDSKGYWGFTIRLPVGTYTIRAIHTGEATSDEYINGKINNANGEWVRDCNIVSGGHPTVTINVGDGDVLYIYNAKPNLSQKTAKTVFDAHNIQLEVGNTATAYEPYQGEEFVSNSGATIPALAGVNTLWADVGEITVAGKKDLVKVIADLAATVQAITGV